MRTERTTRERRLHRDTIDKYVFEPSRDYAAAFGLIGFGVGMCIVAVWASHPVITPLALIISSTSVFAGVGWALMIRQRLIDYYHDIMMDRVQDEAITTEHDEPKLSPRQIPDSNGNVILELATAGKLDARQWRDVAYALRVHKLNISQAVFSKNKDTKIMSQPQYKWWYNHMITNHLMTTEPNELTQAGMDKLDALIAPTPRVN